MLLLKMDLSSASCKHRLLSNRISFNTITYLVDNTFFLVDKEKGATAYLIYKLYTSLSLLPSSLIRNFNC